MKQYQIRRAYPSADLSLTSDAWAKAAPHPLDQHLWPESYPIFYSSQFQLLQTDNALHIRLKSNESPVTIRITEEGGPVHLDSCLEFFWSPDITKPDYFNFEFNAAGILHVKYGPDRGHRHLFAYDKTDLSVESSIDESGWAICFRVPFSLLSELGITPTTVTRANFYKCGDDTATPHYSSWNPVTSETPDFHRPSDFGELIVDFA